LHLQFCPNVRPKARIFEVTYQGLLVLDDLREEVIVLFC
jgi:hypothetical protein